MPYTQLVYDDGTPADLKPGNTYFLFHVHSVPALGTMSILERPDESSGLMRCVSPTVPPGSRDDKYMTEITSRSQAFAIAIMLANILGGFARLESERYVQAKLILMFKLVAVNP